MSWAHWHDMEWERVPQDDPADPDGVRDLIARAGAAIGGPPLTGTVFLHTARTMLAHTREIEGEVRGVDTLLYVGFQAAHRFDVEARNYRDLVTSGTRVVAFGIGRPQHETGVRWVELDDRPRRLENQWFLVTRAPEPIAFVGFETSPDVHRMRGGAGARGRTWQGFVSGDKRLVDALIEHLAAVAEEGQP